MALPGGYLDHETLAVFASGSRVVSTYRLDPGFSYLARVNKDFYPEHTRDAGIVYDRSRNQSGDGGQSELFKFSTDASLIFANSSSNEYVYSLRGNDELLEIRFLAEGSSSWPYAWSPNGVRVDVQRDQPQASLAVVWFGRCLLISTVLAGTFYGVRGGTVMLERMHEWRRQNLARIAAAEKEVAARIAAENTRREAESKREGEKTLAAERERRFRELCLEYKGQSHYEDPKYLTKLASRDRKEIIKRKDQTIREYIKLHQDPDLVAMLRHKRPETYRRLTSRIKLLRLAEWIDVMGEEPEAPNLTSYEALDLFGDDQFIEKYARKNQNILLDDYDRIILEYERRHSNKDFIRRTKRDQPEVYRRLTWEIRALVIALRLSVEPQSQREQPKSESTKKERPRSAEEERQEKVRRQEAEDDEKLAMAEARLRKIRSIQEILDRYDLSPEDRAMAENMLREALGETANGGGERRSRCV